MANTTGIKASDIQVSNTIIVWPGFTEPQTVTKVAQVIDPDTGAAMIEIELDGQEPTSWSPNSEFELVL